MAKELSEMTLEELWQLFPIALTEHQEKWSRQYSDMARNLEAKLSSCSVLRISHIGSTAIPSIWAKPIVDILVEIAPNEALSFAGDLISDLGFIKMSESETRVSFNCGYTPEGFADAVYHLHLRTFGDNSELYFRDYLNEFTETAREYERLKLRLWQTFEFDRDAYTAAKTEFVEIVTRDARARYGNRYGDPSIMG